jgi:hypothetical protein
MVLQVADQLLLFAVHAEAWRAFLLKLLALGIDLGKLPIAVSVG